MNIGAIVLAPIAELARSSLGNTFASAHLLFYGVVLVLVMLFMPNGIVGLVQTLDRRIDNLKPHIICRLGMTRTFQIVQPFPEMTALENVMMGALVHHHSTVEA